MNMAGLLLCALLVVACNTPGAGSSAKEVSATGVFWNGRTVGPVARQDGRQTIIDCASADEYRLMKQGGVVEAAVWTSHGCKPLLVGNGGGAAFLAGDDYAALLKIVKKVAWSDCLQNQFWFCDGTKVDAEIEAAFSMTTSQGKWISGADWVDSISRHIVAGYAKFLAT